MTEFFSFSRPSTHSTSKFGAFGYTKAATILLKQLEFLMKGVIDATEEQVRNKYLVVIIVVIKYYILLLKNNKKKKKATDCY